MGKKYLVEEIESMDEGFSVFVGYIIIIGIALLINYFFFKSFWEGIINFKNNSVDAESLGVIAGILLSWIIFLIVFILNFYKSFFDIVDIIIKKMFYTTVIVTIISSIVTPIIVYFYNYRTLDFSLWGFIKTVIGNTILFFICSPLLTLIGFMFICVIGYIISKPIYYFIYLIKSKKIKKTKCWEQIKDYCVKEDIERKILKIELEPSKISFYDYNDILIKDLSFRELGYSDLTELSEIALIKTIKRETSVNFKIKTRYMNFIEVINKNLQKRMNIAYKDIIKKEKRTDMILKRSKKIKEKEKKKQYKRNIKEGKDW